jgi:hypothetical protein
MKSLGENFLCALSIKCENGALHAFFLDNDNQAHH